IGAKPIGPMSRLTNSSPFVATKRPKLTLFPGAHFFFSDILLIRRFIFWKHFEIKRKNKNLNHGNIITPQHASKFFDNLIMPSNEHSKSLAASSLVQDTQRQRWVKLLGKVNTWKMHFKTDK